MPLDRVRVRASAGRQRQRQTHREVRKVKRVLSLTRIASFPSIFPIEGGAAIFTFCCYCSLHHFEIATGLRIILVLASVATPLLPTPLRLRPRLRAPQLRAAASATFGKAPLLLRVSQEHTSYFKFRFPYCAFKNCVRLASSQASVD